jgi:putative membrane protein
MTTLFSDDDRQRIADAIGAAEAETSGEIVPYVVLRSHTYAAVPWRGGVLGALAGLALVALVRAVLPAPPLGLAHDGVALLLALGCGGLGAVLAATTPPLTRWLAGAEAMTDAVHRRALQAFVEEEVFATRDRTGILLFISLLEHRVEVLADAGIYAQGNDDVWKDVTTRVRAGIESGRLADGLVEAIGRCGRLLEEHGAEARPDDSDELPDRLHLRDE